jgi:hypothetical protein
MENEEEETKQKRTEKMTEKEENATEKGRR